MSEVGQVFPPSPEQDEPAADPTGILTGDPIPAQRVNVHKCGACDNRHDDIEIKEFARQLPPFTHFYICPNVGDPVPLTLAMMSDGNGMELHGPTMQSLACARMAGRWIAVVGYIEDGKLLIDKHADRFPMADYFEQGPDSPGFIKQLLQMLESEAGIHQPAEMRPAPPRTPLRTLNGNGSAPPLQEQFKIGTPRTEE